MTTEAKLAEALRGLLGVLSELSQIEDGKTLFEHSPSDNTRCLLAWSNLDVAIKRAREALQSRAAEAAQPLPQMTDAEHAEILAKYGAAQAAEPVEWQCRTLWLKDGSVLFDWSNISQQEYEAGKPGRRGEMYRVEYRELYTHPQPPAQDAEAKDIHSPWNACMYRGYCAKLRDALGKAVAYVREEASKYTDDGSNEPLELARDIDYLLTGASGYTKQQGAGNHSSCEVLDGLALVAAECRRHVGVEGWTPEHDDEHTNFELSSAACCYGQMGSGGPYSHSIPGRPPRGWPWASEWWKPSEDPIRNLVKAGSLIVAEINRLLRAEKNR